MGIPVLNNFLGCFTIRTGALVIGWLSMINSSLSLIRVIFGVIGYFELPDKRELILAFSPNATFLNETGGVSEASIERAEYGLQVAIVFICLLTLAKFTLDLLYLIGVCKKNACLMFPMIILYGLGCLFIIIAVSLLTFATIALCFVKLGNGAQDVNLGILFLLTIILIISTAIAIYTFLIMYSYYRTVDRQQKSQQGAILNDYVIEKEQTYPSKGKEFTTNYVRM